MADKWLEVKGWDEAKKFGGNILAPDVQLTCRFGVISSS